MNTFLSKMTTEQYQIFYDINKNDIIDSITSRGTTTQEDALLKFERMWKSLAPDGFEDKYNHYLNIFIEDISDAVGYIWLTERTVESYRYAFLSSIMIFPKYRRRGFGTLALLKLELFIKELGIKELRFQVDGENEIAYQLYKKLNYKVTAHLMRKEFID